VKVDKEMLNRDSQALAAGVMLLALAAVYVAEAGVTFEPGRSRSGAALAKTRISI